jgi:hypothetical protein
VFGLGYETPSGKGWIDGGDPTAGLLGKGTSGPFADFYQSPVGDWWVTPLFMVGLAGIGLGLSPRNGTACVSRDSVGRGVRRRCRGGCCS